MAVRKSVSFRIYDVAGTFIGAITDANFESFRKVINGGFGDMTITLAMTFAACYESNYTIPGNRIEMLVVDAETPPGGKIMYSGFIVSRNPTIDGNKEEVKITCRGHAAKLPYLPLKSGTTTIIKTNTSTGLGTAATASAATLDNIFRALIDRYRAETVYPVLNYNSYSMEAFTETLTYIFKTKNLKWPLDKLVDAMPVGAYWYVDGDNIVHLKHRSTTPDHYLTLGAHFEKVEDSETLDGMINRFHFAYSGSPATKAKVFSRTASSTKNGEWWEWKSDGRYTVETEVARVAGANLDAYSVPQRQMVVTVLDNASDRMVGYDIESFEPGQTVAIQNLPIGAQQNFPKMLQIASVEYSLDHAVLELNTPVTDLARALAQLEASENAETSEDVPTSYTAG